jgi:hypothetical protein
VAERQQRLKELEGQIESVNRTLDERVQLQAGQKSRLHLLEQLQRSTKVTAPARWRPCRPSRCWEHSRIGSRCRIST